MYFSAQTGGEELGESGDPLRPAGHPCGQHVGAGEAEVGESFIASEEVDYFDFVGAAGIERIQGGEERLDCEMNLNDLQLLTSGRTEATS